MTLTDEERRAQDYRQQQERRCVAEAARVKRLKGNPAARQTLAEHWQPLIDATNDVRAGSDEECDE